MKTLLILRHAKAVRPTFDLHDFDRALSGRGRRDADAVGHWLEDEGLQPDLVIASSAHRTRETAELVCEAAELDDPPVLLETLYGADAATWLSILRTHAEGADTVLLVGHNPTMEVLVERVTGHDETMKTAALAHTELDIDAWASVSRGGAARLISLWRPAKRPK